MVVEHRERDPKFDIPADWQLPDPAKFTDGGSIERTTARLETTYFDTARWDLLRQRVELRRRIGDVDEGWQLKLSAADFRTEVRLPHGGRSIPAELIAATVGVSGGASLKRLAVLVTNREINRLYGQDGTALVDIVVDSVTATRTRGVGGARRWRQLEIELIAGDERLVEKLSRWLIKHGAEVSPSASKVASAVGFKGVPARDPNALSGLIGAYLDVQMDSVIRSDVAFRRGQNAVHDARAATRRFRAVLRVFRKLFVQDHAAALDAELRWYGHALGSLHDRQVLHGHMAAAVAELPPDVVVGMVSERIRETLTTEMDDAGRRLASVLRSKRYFALLAALRAWCDGLPVSTDEPAAHVERYLSKAAHAVHHKIKSAPDGEGHDQALHPARKAARRARFVAEIAIPALGRRAKVIEKAMRKTTDRLGERQDCIVAADFLRRLADAATAAGENGFTYGVLYEREVSRARAIDGR